MGLYMRTSHIEYNEFCDGRWPVDGVIRYEWQKLYFIIDFRTERNVTNDTFLYLLPKIKCSITYFIN
jgi:hypothetical protein